MALTVQGWPRVVSSAAPAETATARMGPSRDRTALAVGLVAVLLSTASTYYYFRRHLILGYQDSFSHLEISRRVVAGLSPGIAQLGGIWLPVPQLLQDLFSWNDALYRTGVMRLPNPAEPVDVIYFALHDSPRLRSYRLIYHSPAYLIYGLPTRP